MQLTSRVPIVVVFGGGAMDILRHLIPCSWKIRWELESKYPDFSGHRNKKECFLTFRGKWLGDDSSFEVLVMHIFPQGGGPAIPVRRDIEEYKKMIRTLKKWGGVTAFTLCLDSIRFRESLNTFLVIESLFGTKYSDRLSIISGRVLRFICPEEFGLDEYMKELRLLMSCINPRLNNPHHAKKTKHFGMVNAHASNLDEDHRKILENLGMHVQSLHSTKPPMRVYERHSHTSSGDTYDSDIEDNDGRISYSLERLEQAERNARRLFRGYVIRGVSNLRNWATFCPAVAAGCLLAKCVSL
eukprot:CAMPEP_0197535468 /NCGR_PEP_ID=MMETSP1318-20131121/50650_1 /TAXON_ID=552666 /ORGANISM="Partenskyella glossopodia, Strain RCC365" /LENGTH=298 /DNA_ID=CAMNT_0043093049 /DNA_START=350 /DNA_END=1246 /DNA_ORIENTATION=+